MVKLKSVQLQHCISNPQIWELCRSLKNWVHIKTMNNREWEKQFLSQIRSPCIKSFLLHSKLCVRSCTLKVSHYLLLLPFSPKTSFS